VNSWNERHVIKVVEESVRTYYAKPGEVEREWLVVDATDIPLGRLASEIASILKGKRKPQYTPHVDVGDFVIVVNAEKIKLTGNKLADKRKYRHSGYPGGLKSISIGDMLIKHPERVIEGAVKGMLPKNTLGRAMGMKLKVYAGPEHPHQAQMPRQITLEV
jgi:large subunit ribosomal protein L13